MHVLRSLSLTPVAADQVYGSRVLWLGLGFRAETTLHMSAGNVQPSQPQVKDSFAANLS